MSVTETKSKASLLENMQKTLAFELNFIYELNLSSVPIFIINTLANSIAEFIKCLLTRKNLQPENYLS